MLGAEPEESNRGFPYATDVSEVRAVSPEKEMRVAKRLREMIARAWPDVADSRSERTDPLVSEA